MSTVALSLLAIFKEADGSFRTVKDLLEEKFIKPKHIAPGGKPLDFETKLTPLFPLTADLRDTDDNVKVCGIFDIAGSCDNISCTDNGCYGQPSAGDQVGKSLRF